MPEDYEKFVHCQYNMPNTTISRAQVRSISVNTEGPPDKWVHHMAKYEYTVEIEFKDDLRHLNPSPPPPEVVESPISPESPVAPTESDQSRHSQGADADQEDSDSSSDDE